jgi:hypothetical protein
MNDALTRLRAADPATGPAGRDPRSPEARALLERIVSEPAEGGPAARSKHRRKRLVLGIAGAAVAAAVATFFVVDPAAAYTVDRQADGSVVVTFRADRLKDPGKLNAELKRAGARTVLFKMVPGNRCTEVLDQDPAFPLHASATPAEIDRYPVAYQPESNGVRIFIRPDKMPPGDMLAFGFLRDGHDTIARPVVVRTMPSCMALPPHRPGAK